ncbi:hypothetical protein BDR03DRAFT_971360, partial [Suillus americanus]
RLMLHDVPSSNVRLLIRYPMVFSMESHQLTYVIAITLSIILISAVSVLSTTRSLASQAFISPQPLQCPGYITVLPSRLGSKPFQTAQTKLRMHTRSSAVV